MDALHPVACFVMHRDDVYCVHFVENDFSKGVGPWLLFDTLDDMERQLFAWANANPDDWQREEAMYSRQHIPLPLTHRQYLQLKARAIGWPWNGFELTQMHRAGRYPPRLLTANEEEQFLSRRKP